MSDLAVARRLIDVGVSAGEAAAVIQQARASLDSTTETVELAAGRVLDTWAAEIEGVAADYRSAADRLRHAPAADRSAA